jgi:hypothetical protein
MASSFQLFLHCSMAYTQTAIGAQGSWGALLNGAGIAQGTGKIP